jgi:ABC-type sulfate transport system permease component
MGEYGSVVLIAAKVKIASLVIFADIESGAPQAAASMSAVLLLIALLVLLGLRRWGTRGAR